MSKELFVEIAIVACLVVLWCRFLSKKAGKRMRAAGAAALALAGLASGLLMMLAPLPSDTVEITALDQMNEASGSSELYLTNIRQDGKEVALPDSTSGKWYWLGDWYCWRPPGDQRIPTGGEGLTQTIQIKVPIGYQREFEFVTNKNKGLVSVAFAGETQTVDCYSSSDARVKVQIASSGTLRILISKAVRLGVFALLAVLLGALSLWGLMRLRQRRERFDCLIKNHWDKLAYAMIAAAMLVFMIINAGKQSFWGDEMHQIGMVRDGLTLRGILEYYVTLDDANPPLYALLFAVWYRIAPYGTGWLLLPSEICVAAGVFLLGILGNRMGGRRTGIFAVLLAATSSVLTLSAGFEIRTYSLFFLLSVCVLITYTYKLDHSNVGEGQRHTKSSVHGAEGTEDIVVHKKIYKYGFNWMRRQGRKYHVLYGVFLALMAYSHYYGLILCGLLFLFDALLFFKKRHSIRFISPYVLAGIAYLPYIGAVAVMFLRGQLYRTGFEGAPPKPANIEAVLRFITGGDPVVFYLLLLGTAWGLARGIVKMNRKQFDWRLDFQRLMLIGMIWLNMLFVYVFVRLTQNDILVNRYFIGILPCIVLLCAMTLNEIVLRLPHANDLRRICTAAIGIFLLLATGLPSAAETVSRQESINQPFEEVARYLTAQGDFYSPDIAVLLCGRDPMRYGWQYYLTQGGRRDERPVLSWSNQEDVALLPAYQKIYIYYPYKISDGFKSKLRGWGFEQIHENKTNHFLTYEKKKRE